MQARPQLGARFIIIVCAVVSSLAPIAAVPSVQAQEPCEYLPAGAWAQSATGSTNRGTQGLGQVPTSYEVNLPDGFLAQSVWVFNGSNGFYSSEVGYGYGYSLATNTFRTFWAYYHAAHDGQFQWDDNRALAVGGFYYVSVWFNQTSSGTILYAYATPDGGGYPTWSHAVPPPRGWSGSSWTNYAQGETNTTCGYWYYAQWYNMAWTTNGSTWYYWGMLDANSVGAYSVKQSNTNLA